MGQLIYKMWIAIAIMLGFSSLISWLGMPDEIAINTTVTVIFVTVSILVLFPKRIKIMMIFRSLFFKNLISNLITIFLIFNILSLINYLGFKNNFQLDITEYKLNTLSDQSRIILNDIKSKMEFKLYAKRADWSRYLQLLDMYKDENNHITIDVVDTENNPSLLEANNISENGTLSIVYRNKKVSKKIIDERSVTNLILKTLRDNKIKIYYITGHNELPLNSSAGGLSFLFDNIKNAAYELTPLDLLANGEVPNDATALMLLGPKSGLMDLEIKHIKEYLDNGGNLLTTLAPLFKQDIHKNLIQLLKNYGIDYINAITLDKLATVQGVNASIPIVNEYNPNHVITKNFSGRTLFPISAAFRTFSKEDFVSTWIARTSLFPASWAELSFDQIKTGKAVYDSNDIKGPISLAVVSETKLASRIAAFASSTFIVNGYKNQTSNFNLFLNTLAWLTNDEGIISISRPELSQERIFMSEGQLNLIFYFSILFVPSLLLLISILLYRKRRQS